MRMHDKAAGGFITDGCCCSSQCGDGRGGKCSSGNLDFLSPLAGVVLPDFHRRCDCREAVCHQEQWRQAGRVNLEVRD